MIWKLGEVSSNFVALGRSNRVPGYDSEWEEWVSDEQVGSERAAIFRMELNTQY